MKSGKVTLRRWNWYLPSPCLQSHRYPEIPQNEFFLPLIAVYVFCQLRAMNWRAMFLSAVRYKSVRAYKPGSQFGVPILSMGYMIGFSCIKLETKHFQLELVLLRSKHPKFLCFCCIQEETAVNCLKAVCCWNQARPNATSFNWTRWKQYCFSTTTAASDPLEASKKGSFLSWRWTCAHAGKDAKRGSRCKCVQKSQFKPIAYLAEEGVTTKKQIH